MQLPTTNSTALPCYRSLDVIVPLGLPNHKEATQMGCLPGSVLGSGQAREWLQFLMGRQPQDALLYLRKWLREAARKEEVQLKAGRSKLTGMHSDCSL